MTAVDNAETNGFIPSAFLDWEVADHDLPWTQATTPEKTEAAESDTSKRQNRPRPYLRAVGTVAVFAGLLVGVPIVSSEFTPADQRPTFAATHIDGCYVSDDWHWVQPRNGIDDLVIHNVQGVTSEQGKGAKCLRAAAIVIADWANNDNNPRNNINLDLVNPYGDVGQPIIVAGEWYAVPQFATPTPQR
jgi:hypothetical protein